MTQKPKTAFLFETRMTRRNWPKGFTLLSHVSRSPTSIGRRRYVAVVSASTSNRKKEKTQVVKKKERGVEMILIKDHRSNKNTKTIKKMQATEAVSSPDGNIMKKKTVKTSKTKNTSSSNRCIRPPEPEGFSEDGSDNYSLPRGITMRPSGKWVSFGTDPFASIFFWKILF